MNNNRPNIEVKDYERETRFLIDTSVPTDNNISVKEYNKIRKYKNMEIKKWKKTCLLKTNTVPVKVGALDVIKKGTDRCINRITVLFAELLICIDISSDKLAKSHTRRPGHGYEKEIWKEKLNLFH